jgi:hypothetical protein
MTLFEPQISVVRIPPEINTLYLQSDHDNAELRFLFLGPAYTRKTFEAKFHFGRTKIDLRSAIRAQNSPIYVESFPCIQDELSVGSHYRTKLFVINHDRQAKVVSILAHSPIGRQHREIVDIPGEIVFYNTEN